MIKIYSNYLFKTKFWICGYRVIMIGLMVILVNILNIDILDMEKLVRDYKKMDPYDQIFVLHPTLNGEVEEMDETKVNGIYNDVKEIENVEWYYILELGNSRIYIVNRAYFNYINVPITDKTDCLEMCIYVGENRIKSLFPLGLKDKYTFSDGIEYKVSGTLPKKLVRLGTNLREVQLEDQVIIVTNDKLYGNQKEHVYYNENFTQRSVFMMKFKQIPTTNDWNDLFKYAQSKTKEVSEVLKENGSNVQFFSTSIGGRENQEKKYLNQLWDKNKIETYALACLLVGVLASLFLFELISMKNFFNVLRLNGISIGKLVLLLFLEQTILYEFGILLGIILCYQLNITLFLDLSIYIFIAGIALAAIFSVYGGINIYQKNLIDGLRERN